MFRNPYARCPMDGAALAPLQQDPLIGTIVAGRYTIEACIGEGGMGRVYRARHLRVSRLFAIKVLYGDHAADIKMRERFAREAESASRMSHPNVISVIDFGETERQQLYLAMDYVEGRNLAQVITAEGPLPARRVRRILRQLCAGLAHAHDSGLVHRDFKGDNVLVTGSGEDELVRIVDFGLAVIAESADQRLTTQGMVLGTPAYMSPEQSTGDVLDHRTDLFSLGVVLYEMLAGTLPFEGSPVAMAQQNLTCDPPPVARRVPGLLVDAQLEQAARKLMARSRDERFQSAREVVAALDGGVALGETMPMAASRPDEVSGRSGSTIVAKHEAPATPWRRRALVAALALVLLGGGALLIGRSSRGEVEPAPSADPGISAPAPGPAQPAVAADTPAANTPAADTPAADAPGQAAAERGGGSPLHDAVDEPGPAGPALSTSVEPGESPAHRSRSRRDGARRGAAGAGAREVTGEELITMYTRVGGALQRLLDERGSAVSERYRRAYRDIPIHDAQRTPALRIDVYNTLHALERQITRELARADKE